MPERIARCPASEVNPLTGERDANPVVERRNLRATGTDRTVAILC
jgi:hypothetical protein